MKLIDTHAHLQFEKFEPDREEVVEKNLKILEAIINPGADLESSKNAVLLAQKYPNLYSAVGVHPHHVDNWTKDYLPQLEKLVTQEKVVGFGEIGLDKHVYQGYKEPDIKAQISILEPQIQLAIKYSKPILFHCRKAYDELYEVIKDFKPLVGLVHCFMGDIETAQKFVNLGLLISFAGNITYKNNEHMRNAVKHLPSSSILLETDSPYLTPEPHRGTRNEPTNVSLVAQQIAQMRNQSLEEVAKFTTENARKLFEI